MENSNKSIKRILNIVRENRILLTLEVEGICRNYEINYNKDYTIKHISPIDRNIVDVVRITKDFMKPKIKNYNSIFY